MPERADLVSVDDAAKPLFFGVDVGGTNIKLGLVDDQGRTVGYHSIPTDVEKGPDAAVERIAEGVDHVVRQAEAEPGDLARIGVATPTADIKTGHITTPGNLPGWWHFPIRDRISELCGKPVRYSNDANAAAFGEYWSGAAAEYHSMVMLTLGTGVGGGIIVGDQLIEGANSLGGECGHILLDPSDDARVDSFGKVGSLEAYCGAYSIVGRANDAVDAGEPSSLASIREAGREITPLDIAKATESGDKLARKVFADTAHYLGLAIVTFVHTIDPEALVIGGGVDFGGPGHPLGEEFLQLIRDAARPRLLAELRDNLLITFAELGGDAGYIGAAGLARLEHHKDQ